MTKTNDQVPLCTYDRCGRRARSRVEWNFVHRGRQKQAQRLRCKEHERHHVRSKTWCGRVIAL